MANAHGESPGAEILEWKTRVSFFRNNPVTRQIAVVVGVPFGLLLLWMAKRGFADGAREARYAFYFVGFFLAIGALFVTAVFGGGYDVEYRLDESGVYAANQERQRKRLSALFRLGLILSLFARSFTAAGSSLLARGSLRRSLRWSALRAAKFNPKERLIVVKGNAADKIYLFCTPENYETVRAIVERRLRLSKSAAKRKADSARS
ncbi:MAG: hypothetical protein MR616_04140 [Pyramidobacter sp.]|nr:hypothetical protein [Pyramidobacter sp.]